MLQPFPAHLPIPPPQSLRLAITQLQHDRCIAQLQRPTAHSPHDFHPLQLTTAHGCPLQQDLPWLEVLVYGDISNESARGHYQRGSTPSQVHWQTPYAIVVGAETRPARLTLWKFAIQVHG